MCDERHHRPLGQKKRAEAREVHQPELPHHQPHQPSLQIHGTHKTQHTEKQCREIFDRRADRIQSSVLQIINFRVIIEKHLHQQHELFQNF
ncbi:hypothetical protein DPMN_105202 [Dreissena polymorpha]|uniref:Uncharacterized protein n=1 Tax=Dreissena polymorpha TaxID=45954 RepID=A0A9D4HCX3_DREPO|nr:hypothetical protein DPMN_105202 [Dreissena polymorpha]